MRASKDLVHVLVLPEDDANRQLVNGFSMEFPTRQIQALRVAGGWRKVLRHFEPDHLNPMDKYPARLMVLLMDFDGKRDRLDQARAVIPEHLIDRVFVLGAWTESEDLRQAKLALRARPADPVCLT